MNPLILNKIKILNKVKIIFIIIKIFLIRYFIIKKLRI